jgi:HSP20 family protein
MSLVRWDPFKNMATLQDRINRLFDDAFPRNAGGDEELSASAWHPLVDIFETDQGGVSILVDLPGVNKEDVSVEVKENVLTIRGERKLDQTVADDRYFRRERAFGTFQRSFATQTIISPGDIKATFKKGVLKIEVPKPQEVKPKQVAVNID